MISPKKIFQIIKNYNSKSPTSKGSPQSPDSQSEEKSPKSSIVNTPSSPKNAERLKINANNITSPNSSREWAVSTPLKDNSSPSEVPISEMDEMLQPVLNHRNSAGQKFINYQELSEMVVPDVISESFLKKAFLSLSSQEEIRTKKVFPNEIHIFCFVIAMISRCIGSVDEKISYCFRLFDENHDDQLTKDELVEFISFVSNNIKLSDKANRNSMAVLMSRKSSMLSFSNTVSEISSFQSQTAQRSSIDKGRRASMIKSKGKIDSSSNNPGMSFYNDINNKLSIAALASHAETTESDRETHVQSNADFSKVDYIFKRMMRDLKMDIEDPNLKFNLNSLLQWIHKYSTGISFVAKVQSHREAISKNAKWFIGNDERNTIKNILSQTELAVGDVCYVLSTKWWRAWTEYVKFYDFQSLEDNDTIPPAIDNSDLIDSNYEKFESIPFYPLKKNLVEGSDFVVLPAFAWFNLYSWYGGGPDIARQVVSVQRTAKNNPVSILILVQAQVDLHPFLLEVGHYDEKRSIANCIISRFESIGGLINVICNQLDLDPNGHYALWLSKPDETIKLKNDPDKALNSYPMSDGSLILIEKILENSVSSELINSRSLFSQQISKTEGLVGLANLGNTCYFNSCVQCLSHIDVLTDYFLSGAYRKELLNKPGTNLKIVSEYADFLRNIWNMKSGSVFSPLHLRSAITRISPQFAGYSQHDSQELLGMLIDYLHEDLNRVQEKKYTENPDWKGESDEVFEKIFWEAHLKRNQSFFVKLFQGQLKSAIECAKCRHTSINFEPFTCLSIPIPSLMTRVVQVTVVLLAEGPPINASLKVPSDGTLFELIKAFKATDKKKHLTKEFVIADVQNNYIFNLMKKSKPVSNINDRDTLHLYEYKTSNFKRADSEFNFDKSGMKGKDIYGNTTRIHFIHRKYKDNWFGGKTQKIVLTGTPLLEFIQTSGSMASQELYNLIGRRLEVVYGLNMNSLKEHFNTSDIKGQSSIAPYPFIIKLTDRTGKECRICDDKLCTGCILLYSTDVLQVGWDDGFAVDWIIPTKNAKILSETLTALEKVIKPKVQEAVEAKDDSITLDACLSRFQMPEPIPQGEWYCSQCKDHSPGSKTISLFRMPPLLIIHINRFKQDYWGITKNSKYVIYPIELDLAKHLPPTYDQTSTKYELISVVNHIGVIQSGHYTSFVFNSTHKKWFLFDDDMLQETTPENVINSEGYILFYQLHNVKELVQIQCSEYLTQESP